MVKKKRLKGLDAKVENKSKLKATQGPYLMLMQCIYFVPLFAYTLSIYLCSELYFVVT